MGEPESPPLSGFQKLLKAASAAQATPGPSAATPPGFAAGERLARLEIDRRVKRRAADPHRSDILGQILAEEDDGAVVDPVRDNVAGGNALVGRASHGGCDQLVVRVDEPDCHSVDRVGRAWAAHAVAPHDAMAAADGGAGEPPYVPGLGAGVPGGPTVQLGYGGEADLAIDERVGVPLHVAVLRRVLVGYPTPEARGLCLYVLLRKLVRTDDSKLSGAAIE